MNGLGAASRPSACQRAPDHRDRRPRRGGQGHAGPPARRDARPALSRHRPAVSRGRPPGAGCAAAIRPTRRRPRPRPARCGRPIWSATICAGRRRTRRQPRSRPSRRCARRCWISSAASPPARGAVLDGRDIGTVIFPDAPVKLFVTAERRGARPASLAGIAARGVAADLRRRDGRDAGARRSATRPRRGAAAAGADAIMLDTTALDADASFARRAAIVRSQGRASLRRNRRGPLDFGRRCSCIAAH